MLARALRVDRDLGQHMRLCSALTPIPSLVLPECWMGSLISAGTGKTVCSRLYGELLEELGILPEGSCFVETSGAKLVSGGVAVLQEALKNTADGGLLFVDEAYQLDPAKNQLGGQVLDVLLTEMEDRRGSLVVVFAGYKDRMETLLDHNEGLPSRFCLVWDFEDFSEDELVAITTQQLASLKPPFTVDSKYARIMAQRLGRQRGVRGFGNARAVRNWLENARDRQAKRILAERAAGGTPNLYELARDDLLGPRSLDMSRSQPLRDLYALRGLKQVKESGSAAATCGVKRGS